MRVLPLLMMPFLLTFLVGVQCVSAQEPTVFNIKETVAIAVYPYRKAYGKLEAENIKFNITQRKQIRTVLSSIDLKNTLDGRALGTLPNAYLYFKDSTGAIGKYRVVLAWQYLLFEKRWEQLFPLHEAGRKILIDNVNVEGGKR